MFLYYTLVIIVLISAGPFLLLIPKCRAGIGEKLGAVPKGLDQRSPNKAKSIWFHAVSVGEFNAVLPLVEQFRARHPEYSIYLSTTTATGQKQAMQKISTWAKVFYFPLDLPWVHNAYLLAINPTCVVIVETERWPGFMHECNKRQIPVIMVNARISPKSFAFYTRFKLFFGPVMRAFTTIVCQNPTEVNRFAELTDISSKRPAPEIVAVGNLKIDGMKRMSEREIVELRASLHLKNDDIVIVGGSTHDQEEIALLKAFKILQEQDLELKSKLKLIIAPRHPERFDKVAQLIASQGYRTRAYSRQEYFETEPDVFLLDTIGQLARHYGLATIAFVGGTINTKPGGHNLLEPFMYEVPVICGPSLHKTRDTARNLQERNALLIVKDEVEIAATIRELISLPDKRKTIGQAGRAYIDESQGAVSRTLKILDSAIGGERVAAMSEKSESATSEKILERH